MELALWVGSFALFGLCIGSFLNVVAYRVPRGESVVAPPSRCPDCGERVRPYDLIPVVSYVLLRGRCRFCGNPIRLRYPAVELLTGTAFAIAAWRMPWSVEALAGALLSAVLIAVVITDIDWRIIPNRIIAWGIGLGLLLRCLSHPLPWWNYALAALACSGLLFLLAIASKGGMGGGDIKLYLFIGLVLGLAPALLSLFAASLFGLLYGCMMLCFKPGFRKDRSLPFAPFIAVGAWWAYLYGQEALDAMLQYLVTV
ncbi:prepilin peptidase [Paenibacillus dendritiformis]|uniref:prepilin peptidase n=1 Tax=Paenibacillus dendritiformis TaxID=130049 RepID=UPI000DA7D3BB|nr:A24 family peptidase [Paenibacillus dendritiformis]PZM64976.1 prepilin peptidase [Paenibacillus dendritiformis]